LKSILNIKEEEMSTGKAVNKIVSFLLALIFVATNTVYSSDGTLRAPITVSTQQRIREVINKELSSLERATEALRTPLIGGNWKMEVASEGEAEALLRNIIENMKDISDVEVVVGVPIAFLGHLSKVLGDLEAKNIIPEGIVKISAQNIAGVEKGAQTGRTSILQVKSLGADYVIIGHSEQRRTPGMLNPVENDAINDKVKLTFKEGLVPIVCVGESLDERENGKTNSIIEDMIRKAFAGLNKEQASKLIVAYEPVWAIGTGKTATQQQAEEVLRFIRGLILDMFGEDTASKVRIIYGGSVKPDNIAGLLDKSIVPDNDGALVGGASLKADSFIGIVKGVPVRFARGADKAPLQVAKPIQIREELKVPEGQPKGFFTNDYHSYTIAALFANPVEQIPDAVVKAIKKKLDQDIAQGKLLSAVVMDFGGTDIDIQVTHRYGELNAAVQRLIIEAMKEGALKAQELGLLKKGTDVASLDLATLGEALRIKYQPHSITERGSEPVVVAKMVGAGIGAANVKLYHEFFMPGSTPLQKLGFVPVVDTKKKEKLPVRGFRAVVRRVDDVLKGNFDGDIWEFEKSAAAEIDGKYYPSKDESLELLALASQPNDFVITAIYAVEGSLLSSNEPVVSVVYQPVYGEKGNLRTLNPTFICRSQSGADAVGGVASMFYDVNFVPGGYNGERYVVTRPVTLREARKAPKEGTAHVVVYGWQSKGNGIIPSEKDGVMDHVAINPPALGPERKLANWLASIMTTHQFDQPYLTPFAAQEQVEPLRKEQGHLFTRAPKEADIDSFMDFAEREVALGNYLSITDDKADMGGKFGHNFTPEYMLAIDVATIREATENGTLSDGNIIGFIDNMKRLRKGTTTAIGDDSHIVMLGDKTRNSADGHQLSFLAFTRGYLAAVVNGEKPYGLAQDYQGKEAKAAKANPYFYSHLTPRFFEILREIMPSDYMGMVDKMEAGWKEWQKTSATVKLPEPFSGNVSQQGIGSARYLVDIKGGERTFGILAGDKMGPAALNRPIREGVYAALAAGEFKNGLVFEIWDAKAFDEHGNIPLDKLPESYADIADAVNELKEKTDQEFVRGSYKDGLLKKDLAATDKKKLAELIKKAGFVPTERIYLDAQQDKEAIYLYLADSDRFNIKQVWSKKTSGWDINNPRNYLFKPVLGSSVTKLGILAGGEYIGKDDPVMVGSMNLMKHIFEFLRTNPLIIQGDMNGSHWLAAIPTASKYAVANKESHPILVGQVYTLSEDGTKLANVEDIFGKREYASIRNKMFEFSFRFKMAQLGGQFEPYGTNWRTVEASYPLAKLLRALQDPNSPFLVKNKPKAEREKKPIGIFKERVALFEAATTVLVEAKRSDKGSPLHGAKAIVTAGKKAGAIITTKEFAQLRTWSARTSGYELQSLVAIGILSRQDADGKELPRGEYRIVVLPSEGQLNEINEKAKAIVNKTGRYGEALGIDYWVLDVKHLGQAKLDEIAKVVREVTGSVAIPEPVPADFVKEDIDAGINLPASAAIQGDVPFTVAGISLADAAGAAEGEQQALLTGLVDARIVFPEAKIRTDAYDFSAVPAKVVMYKEEFVTDTPGQFEAAFKTLDADQTAVIIVINKTDEEIMQALIQANLSEEWGNRIVVMGVKPESPSAQAFGRLFGDKNMYDLRGKKVEDILKDKDLVEGLKGAV